MLTPCPHCDQQIVLDEDGRCPLCRRAVELNVPPEDDRDAADEASQEVEAALNAVTDAEAEPSPELPEQPPVLPAPMPLPEPNPYVAPQTTGPVEAILLPDEPQALPQPGFWVSFVLVLNVWFIQVVGGAAGIVVIVALALVRGTLPEQVANVEEFILSLLDSVGMSIVWLFGSGSVLALGMLLSLFFGRRLWDRLSLRPFTKFQGLLVLMTVVPANLLAVQAALAFAQLLPQGLQQATDLGFDALSWPVVFVAICVFPGIGEELVFRGIIGRGLTARYGGTLGILLTSMLFGFAHLAPAHAFATFLLGIVLHLVFVSTRSLPAAMLLHGLNNAAAMTLYYLREQVRIPGYTHHDVRLFVPLEVLAACALLLAAIAWAFYVTRTRWLLPDGGEWSPGYFSLERPPEALAALAFTKSAHVGLVGLLLVLCGLFIFSLCWAVGVIR